MRCAPLPHWRHRPVPAQSAAAERPAGPVLRPGGGDAGGVGGGPAAAGQAVPPHGVHRRAGARADAQRQLIL